MCFLNEGFRCPLIATGSIGISPLMEQKGMDVEDKRKCTEERKRKFKEAKVFQEQLKPLQTVMDKGEY